MVGERHPMSRIRPLPSATSGSVRKGVKPMIAPSASWRILAATTRSVDGPRTTATIRVPSRETSSLVTRSPVTPGTSTTCARSSTTSTTRARPAPRSSTHTRPR